MGTKWRGAIRIPLIGSALLVAISFTDSFATHLENGRSIFMSGTTAQGRIVQNSHGMEGVGCAMCHGPDGRGGMMHGMPVPNITFRFLTDPRGYEHVTGRKRPAHNEETIKAAIMAGIDSAGNALDPEMPRWTGLTSRDLEDLIGFPKSLGQMPSGTPQTPEGL
jgi:hypothetical protein